MLSIPVACSSNGRTFRFNHLVSILLKAGFRDLVYAILNPSNIDGMKPADYIAAHADEINARINHKVFADIRQAIPSLTPSDQFFTIPIHYPEFNMPHLVNNCHFNVCILLISMLSVVVEYIMMAETDTPEVHLLRSVIGETFNEECRRPSDCLKLMELIGCEIGRSDFVNITIRNLRNLLYTCSHKTVHQGREITRTIDKSLFLLWHYSDEKITVDETVRKYRPLYLVVEVQQDNLDRGVESAKVERTEFEVTVDGGQMKLVYKLAAVIIATGNLGGHFVLAATFGGIEGRIMNDMNGRLDVVDFTSKAEFDRFGPIHPYACYYGMFVRPGADA